MSGTTASQFLADVFAASTAGPIYLSSLGNADAPAGEPGERHVITRSTAEIEAFVGKWDRPHRGLYFCVSPLTHDAEGRSKQTVAELAGLHADVDLKDIEETPEEVWRALTQLKLPPSKIVSSGHGFHLYWHFRKGLPADANNVAKIEQLLRALCRHLSGDRQVCEVARLMRLPGTHNSKFGEWKAVEVVEDRPAARYEVDELVKWLKDAVPVLTRKPAANGTANGHDPDNPFLAFATGTGKPPIDVEARLAAMTHQGPGETSIHATQLSVTAAMLNRGDSIDEVVDQVFSATCQAAGAAGNTWNWSKEQRDIRKLCLDWLAKHPELKEKQPAEDASDRAKGQESEQTKASRWNWHFHGDPDVQESVAYLVHGLIPEIGTGLMPGQWGIYKTFVALDLAGAVMAGTSFIEFPVVRRGAVLFIACEGENEIALRLKAMVEKRCGSGKAPFAWIEGCPSLIDPKNRKILIEMVNEAAERMMEDFNLPVALIIIDTTSKAAGYTKVGEDNDPVLGQIVIETMKAVAKGIKAFVLGVAHFGKDASTGTRGAMSKEDAVDFIFALLGERDLAGTVTNPRAAIRKRRSGPLWNSPSRSRLSTWEPTSTASRSPRSPSTGLPPSPEGSQRERQPGRKASSCSETH